jgi:signal transduction histidine kinase
MAEMRVRWQDGLLPAGIAVIAVTELASMDIEGRAAAGILELLACALLVFRRRWPLVVGTTAGLLCASPPWVGPAVDDVATAILIGALSCYTLARWVPSLVGLVGLGAMLLMILGVYVVEDVRDNGLGDVVFVLALLVPPYVFGRVTRRLAEHTEVLRREQELIRREAVRVERDRIARELHDVIAHSISAMVVQVAAAQDLVRRDPERAEETLQRVAETGRRALSETGRLLHVIRDTDDELGLAPTPGLRDLEALVEELRGHGLAVELVVDPGPPGTDLPAAVDVSAYRIVQEALTNALRYAPDRAVRLEVSVTGSGLTIHTLNRYDGASGLGSGLGLVGLAERVDLLGGTLRHGPSPAGDYELVATLPVVRELV